jgi:hypothetical protein
MAEGHCLVIPRKHVTHLESLSSYEIAALGRFVSFFAPLLLSAVGAIDYNMFVNAGQMAGQRVHHLHIHLVPRHSPEDPIGRFHALFANSETLKPPSLIYTAKLRDMLVRSTQVGTDVNSMIQVNVLHPASEVRQTIVEGPRRVRTGSSQ